MKRKVMLVDHNDIVYLYLHADGAPGWMTICRGTEAQATMAEAMLLAAAPQLLEACRAALPFLPTSPELVETQAIRAQLQAAIDAATDMPARDITQRT